MLLILILLGWLAVGGLCGYVASQKNRCTLCWVVTGFFLGLFALIAIAAVPKLEKDGEGGTTKTNDHDEPAPPLYWVQQADELLAEREKTVRDLEDRIKKLENENEDLRKRLQKMRTGA